MAFPCESATIDCVATLEYPQYSPLDNRAVFFDALTLCYNETYGENRPIVCSVRFDRSSEHDILEVGAYQIVLLVRIFVSFGIRLQNFFSLFLSAPISMYPVRCVTRPNSCLWVTFNRYGFLRV